jgi:hypothetical protein
MSTTKELPPYFLLRSWLVLFFSTAEEESKVGT